MSLGPSFLDAFEEEQKEYSDTNQRLREKVKSLERDLKLMMTAYSTVTSDSALSDRELGRLDAAYDSIKERMGDE